MKLHLLIFIIFISINSVFGASEILISISGSGSGINISDQYNNISNQIIVKTPLSAMYHVKNITDVSFYCGISSDPVPNGAYYVRLYEYTPPNTLVLLDSWSIDYSACWDYYYELSISISTINTSNYSTLGKSLAVGFYATSTSGRMFLIDSNSNRSYSIPSISDYMLVHDNAGNNVTYHYGDYYGQQVRTIYHKYYGGYQLDPPEIAENQTEESINGTMQSYDGYNSSENSTYNNVPAGSGLDQFLSSEGKCTVGNCKNKDLLSWIDDKILLFWWVGYGLVLMKFWYLGRPKIYK